MEIKRTNSTISIDTSLNAIKLADRKECTGCGACVEVCERSAISLEKLDDGFYYPVVNVNHCVKCLKCSKVCPVRNNTISRDINELYIFQHSNELDLKNSSSGGAFKALADYILKIGGLVYGCAFSLDLRSVEHIRVSHIKELKAIQKSKYIQSRVNHLFSEIKQELKCNQTVLFSGTPCQVKALKMYLGRDFDNLLTCAIVCHGVPSESVWQSYIFELENKFKARLVHFDFRDKSLGWHSYGVQAIFSNGKVYSSNHLDDPFMKCYLNNFSLRQSCYSCSFTGCRCGADIMLGDAWKYNNNEKINVSKGVSEIWVFSNKGKALVEKLKSHNFFVMSLKHEDYGINNIEIPDNRDDFFADVNNGLVFSKLTKKYVRESIVLTTKRKIKNMIKQINS